MSTTAAGPRWNKTSRKQNALTVDGVVFERGGPGQWNLPSTDLCIWQEPGYWVVIDRGRPADVLSVAPNRTAAARDAITIAGIDAR